MYFFKSEQKKIKLSSESLENCTIFDAEIFNLRFSLMFFFKLKCNTKKKKKKKIETPYYTSGIRCDTNLEASGSGEFIGTTKVHI